jgi:hypothetical protein
MLLGLGCLGLGNGVVFGLTVSARGLHFRVLTLPWQTRDSTKIAFKALKTLKAMIGPVV